MFERLAYLEGKVDEHSKAFGDSRDAIRHLEERIDRLDDKISRQFVWMVGIQITILVALVSAMLARAS